jgi:hypothetical protein
LADDYFIGFDGFFRPLNRRFRRLVCPRYRRIDAWFVHELRELNELKKGKNSRNWRNSRMIILLASMVFFVRLIVVFDAWYSQELKKSKIRVIRAIRGL